MRRLLRRIAAAAVAVLAAACATAPGPQPAPGPSAAREGAPRWIEGTAPFDATFAHYTSRALRLEKAGDQRGALDAWRIVAALKPENAEPKKRVADLEALLAKEADRRYRQGAALLQEGSPDAARKEFLFALVADPDHAAALDALKNRFDPGTGTYTVAAGDTIEGIAAKVYGDPGKAALVARINDLDPRARPKPGTVLGVPSLAKYIPAAKGAPKTGEAPLPEYRDATEDGGQPAPALPVEAPAPPPPPPAVKAPDPAQQQYARAVELLGAQRHAEAIALAAKLTEHPLLGAQARKLVSDAWFEVGDRALKDERYPEAVEAYRKADPALKDVAGAVASVDRRKKERAEEYYNEGVRLFINQKLNQAIASWEKTLALNPQHPKAPKDIEKARSLQQKLQEIK